MNEPLEDEYSLGEMMRNGNRRTEQVRPQDVIPLWKKGLFSLVATVLVFALLELILALVGIRPVFYEEDPYVGFSAYSPLFIKEQSGGHTVMTTAPNKLDFFNSQQFAKREPAGTYRIFCLGGSTTYGRPYGDRTSFCGWLRALLREADPSKRWEVINCGGVSYASYRVARLMEELIDYHPDLFIVYSAHNEFLEKRTYAEILEKPSLMRDLNALLSRSRIYSAMKSIMAPSRAASGDHRSTLPAEVDALLDRTIGPEDYTRDDTLQEQVLEHYAFNLGRMATITQSGGADIVYVAPASNLRDMSPFKSEHRKGLTPAQLTTWQEKFDHALSKFDAGELVAAMEAITRAAEIDPRHAGTHHLRGKIALAMENHEAAEDAFIRARDEDVCPLRALTPMSRIVEETAAEHGVLVVDFHTLAQRAAQGRIPGKEVFLDHVHPTIETNRELALEILRGLERKGIVNLAPEWNEEKMAEVTARVESGIDSATHGLALRNLSRVLLWAGKYEEAYSLATKAVELAPANPGVHYQLAMANERMGRIDESITHYGNAIELLPTYVEAHYGLGAVLARTGKWDEAQPNLERALSLEPSHVEAKFNLGLAYLKLGRWDDAQALLREVVATRPDHAKAHFGLARVARKRGQNASAREYLTRSIELLPDYAEAYNQLGLLFAAEGAFEEAAEAFQQALEKDPQFPEAHNNWGNLLLLNQRYAEAADRFRQALQLDPAYAKAYYNLGVSLTGLGKTEDAAAAYEKVLELEPRHAQALNNLGTLLAQQRQFETAIRYFEEAISARPDYEEARHNLSVARRLISD